MRLFLRNTSVVGIDKAAVGEMLSLYGFDSFRVCATSREHIGAEDFLTKCAKDNSRSGKPKFLPPAPASRPFPKHAYAISDKPYCSLTRALVENAKQRVPRLRDLSDVGLRNFLTDQEASHLPASIRNFGR
jgi:hypothetical protein